MELSITEEMNENLKLLRKVLSRSEFQTKLQDHIQRRSYTSKELLRHVQLALKEYLRDLNIHNEKIGSWICCQINIDEDTIEVYENDDVDGQWYLFIILGFHWLNQWPVIRWDVEFTLNETASRDRYWPVDLVITEP